MEEKQKIKWLHEKKLKDFNKEDIWIKNFENSLITDISIIIYGGIKMGKFSQLGAINNKIENNNKLCFAKENLSVEQFDKLYKSYRQLFWFQIAPVIVFIVIIIFMLIFIPSDYSNLKSGIILLGIAFFVVPFFLSG